MNPLPVVLTLLFVLLLAPAAAQNELLVRWNHDREHQQVRLPEGTERAWLDHKLLIEQLAFRDQAARARVQDKLTQAGVGCERRRPIRFRTAPNDPEYPNQQTNFTRTGYEAAWELTPGGRTTSGHDVVIAVLDAGFDVGHEDLSPNLWTNPGEIPNDGIDNDGNGYVDDHHGWDFTDDDNDYPTDAHGTQVLGLLGARGNNGIGLSGTNWEAKMMLLSIGNTADIVRAYAYVRDQRELWNRTGGERGAFVVVTNASFGVEGGTCSDFVVWGELYEELGRVGILTAASTANRRWDVDTFGDMPTDCPSEYLIGVTNVDENDNLYTSAAFGRSSVDLGAPGQGSFSTRPGNRYSAFGSTSAAAPYVTGAVALLYAGPCPTLLDRAANDPAAAALMVRTAILSTTADRPNLRSRTVTGGTLDVAAAQLRLTEDCEGTTTAAFRIESAAPNPAREAVLLTTNALVFSQSSRVDLYDRTGRRVRSEPANVVGTNPIRLRLDVSDLPAGVYFVRLVERDRVGEISIVVE